MRHVPWARGPPDTPMPALTRAGIGGAPEQAVLLV